jgi:hypothetical protein
MQLWAVGSFHKQMQLLQDLATLLDAIEQLREAAMPWKRTA